MHPLKVQLFGKPCVQYRDQIVAGFEACKLRELFCYLLLYRQAPHPRESMASLLWGESTTAQSKKYLRQTLWQIQSALHQHLPAGQDEIFIADADWVAMNPAAELWLDVAVFEQAFAQVEGIAGSALDEGKAELLQQAVQLYHGDLMEGCYQDWCLCERERLQNYYLAMLDKLMSYCEAHRQYETGLKLGQYAMRHERARECTHRRLMRLHYLAGDRTAALRQYERCAAALSEELGVKPAKRTLELYERIRADEFESVQPPPPGPGTTNMSAEAGTPIASDPTQLPEVLDHLKQMRDALGQMQQQVQQDIQAVELVLKEQN